MTDQELLSQIPNNPAMTFGKPTIRGLRYSAEWLLETLSSGMSSEEILSDYEDLERADIQANECCNCMNFLACSIYRHHILFQRVLNRRFSMNSCRIKKRDLAILIVN